MNKVSFDRHSRLTERTHLSAKAFRFGKRRKSEPLQTLIEQQLLARCDHVWPQCDPKDGRRRIRLSANNGSRIGKMLCSMPRIASEEESSKASWPPGQRSANQA